MDAPTGLTEGHDADCTCDDCYALALDWSDDLSDPCVAYVPHLERGDAETRRDLDEFDAQFPQGYRD